MPDVITHVTQPSDHSCVAACLAMITGQNVQDVISHVGEKTCFRRERLFLLQYGYDCEVSFDLDSPHVFIATVVSVNLHGLHAVVIDNRDYDYAIFDPNQGREGKKVITLENMRWAYLNKVF